MAHSSPIVALVVAMGENRAIGRGGDLPWHLRSDMRFFRAITMGKPIIMGRFTFASLPRLLDGRVNIVLTRNAAFEAQGAVMAYNLEEALDVAHKAAKKAGVGEIMIIGGADVFREALPLADRIYLTEVHAAPDADTWFPELDGSEWREVSREAHQAGPKDDHAFSVVVLDRTKPGSPRIAPSK